jgi:hypothetical protein
MVHRDASALLTESHNDSGHQDGDEQDEIIGNQQLGVEAPIEYQTLKKGNQLESSTSHHFTSPPAAAALTLPTFIHTPTHTHRLIRRVFLGVLHMRR